MRAVKVEEQMNVNGGTGNQVPPPDQMGPDFEEANEFTNPVWDGTPKRPPVPATNYNHIS